MWLKFFIDRNLKPAHCGSVTCRQQLDLNQTLRKEQDDAYQKSLKADQEKERKKREELAVKASEERRIKEHTERILQERRQKGEVGGYLPERVQC